MKHHATCPDCRAPRRARAARRALPLFAAGLVGAVLPLTTHVDANAMVADKAKKPPFSGFSTTGQAEPMKIEVYEPTIPIPATPQVEIDTGYTTVEADSSSSHGRASEVWPGDAVGEGFTTIVESFGLPLPDSVTSMGYPVQVNAMYPGTPAYDASEPAPGTIERTGAMQHDTTAELSYAASNCSASTTDPGDGTSSGAAGGLPTLPGLPPIPGVPLTGLQVPGLPGLSGQRAAVQAAPAASSSPSATATTGACTTPTELDAVASAGSYVSVSTTHSDAKEVHTTTRSALSDIMLAGGVVKISGVSAQSTTSSNGKKADPRGKSHYGDVVIAGQHFQIGPDGALVGGTGAPIPGLPDDPNAALATLGISFSIPKPVYLKDHAMGSADVQGLIVTIDSKTLSKALSTVPFDMILNMIPTLPAPANMVTSALQAAVHLSPKFVIHLANSETKATTVQPLVFPTPSIPAVSSSPPATSPPPSSSPPASSTAPTHGGGAAGAPGGSTGGGGDVTPPLGDGGPDTSTVPPPSITTPDPVLANDATPVGDQSRLPGLFSFPGLLLYGGLAGGALLGNYVRRIGLAALGDTSSCPHGLNTGLPDLRKA